MATTPTKKPSTWPCCSADDDYGVKKKEEGCDVRAFDSDFEGDVRRRLVATQHAAAVVFAKFLDKYLQV